MTWTFFFVPLKMFVLEFFIRYQHSLLPKSVWNIKISGSHAVRYIKLWLFQSIDKSAGLVCVCLFKCDGVDEYQFKGLANKKRDENIFYCDTPGIHNRVQKGIGREVDKVLKGSFPRFFLCAFLCCVIRENRACEYNIRLWRRLATKLH